MLSVILVNYNTFDYTHKCIQSIYAKTKGLEFEIIVVSNGSHDKKISDLEIYFPSVKIIENTENIGFAKANNVGINAARGEYVILLNSDTELLNDALSIGQQQLIQYPEIGVLTAQLQYPNGKLQHACQSFPSIIAELLETSRLYKLFNRESMYRKYYNARLNLNENNYCDWVWGTFFMFRKADLQKLKLKSLSERFFMYGEDMEWCYQFREAQLKCFYCADAKVIHHLGKSEFGNNATKYATIIRNELNFLTAYKGFFYSFAIRMLRSFKFLLQSLKDKSCLQFALLYAFPK